MCFSPPLSFLPTGTHGEYSLLLLLLLCLEGSETSLRDSGWGLVAPQSRRRSRERGAWAGSQVRWSLFLPPFAVLTTSMKMLPAAGWLAGYLIFPFHVASFPSSFFFAVVACGRSCMDGSGEVYFGFARSFLGYYFSSSSARRCNLGMRKTDCVGGGVRGLTDCLLS